MNKYTTEAGDRSNHAVALPNDPDRLAGYSAEDRVEFRRADEEYRRQLARRTELQHAEMEWIYLVLQIVAVVVGGLLMALDFYPIATLLVSTIFCGVATQASRQQKAEDDARRSKWDAR